MWNWPHSQAALFYYASNVSRLTEYHDMTSQEGALGLSKRYPGAFLWISVPCTAGCGYWEINKKFESAWVKMEINVTLYIALQAQALLWHQGGVS